MIREQLCRPNQAQLRSLTHPLERDLSAGADHLVGGHAVGVVDLEHHGQLGQRHVGRDVEGEEIVLSSPVGVSAAVVVRPALHLRNLGWLFSGGWG